MSRNLLKRGATCLKTEETRVIDTNALLAKKINRQVGSRTIPMPPQEDGFSQGLSAEVLNVITGENDHDTEVSEQIKGFHVASPEKKQEPLDMGPTPEELRKQAIAEIDKIKKKRLP